MEFVQYGLNAGVTSDFFFRIKVFNLNNQEYEGHGLNLVERLPNRQTDWDSIERLGWRQFLYRGKEND
jgi:hypothetical protein